jgi:hypothetical protein
VKRCEHCHLAGCRGLDDGTWRRQSSSLSELGGDDRRRGSDRVDGLTNDIARVSWMQAGREPCGNAACIFGGRRWRPALLWRRLRSGPIAILLTASAFPSDTTRPGVDASRGGEVDGFDCKLELADSYADDSRRQPRERTLGELARAVVGGAADGDKAKDPRLAICARVARGFG